MSLASVTVAFIAALARPRPNADPVAIAERERARLLACIAALEAENARLRRDLAATQALLAAAQHRDAAENTIWGTGDGRKLTFEQAVARGEQIVSALGFGDQQYGQMVGSPNQGRQLRRGFN